MQALVSKRHSVEEGRAERMGEDVLKGHNVVSVEGSEGGKDMAPSARFLFSAVDMCSQLEIKTTNKGN